MPHSPSLSRPTRREAPRGGVTVFETVVAFSLLVTVLSVTAPLLVRHGRLLADQRAYRLAVDELTNQVDRLTALPIETVRAELPGLAPSETAQAALAGVSLTGELEPSGPLPAERGQRLTLKLTWPEGDRRKPPVTLSGWVTPRPGSAVEDTEETAEEAATGATP